MWHERLPQWVSQSRSARDSMNILRNHVETVVTRFRGRVHSWDVINEPLLPRDGRRDGLRENHWLSTIGPRYIGEALLGAKNADPKTLVGINEYGLEDDGSGASVRRESMLALISALLSNGVPIDFLGLQSHLVGGDTYSHHGLGVFLQKLSDL